MKPEIPTAVPGTRRCVICHAMPHGPVAELADPAACVCLDCAERCARWLRMWRPVVLRFRQTGKLKVFRSEAKAAEKKMKRTGVKP